MVREDSFNRNDAGPAARKRVVRYARLLTKTSTWSCPRLSKRKNRCRSCSPSVSWRLRRYDPLRTPLLRGRRQSSVQPQGLLRQGFGAFGDSVGMEDQQKMTSYAYAVEFLQERSTWICKNTTTAWILRKRRRKQVRLHENDRGTIYTLKWTWQKQPYIFEWSTIIACFIF